MRRVALIGSCLALPFFVGSCSSGGTSEPQDSGGFTISVSPAALVIEQGSTGSSTVTLTRTGGFSGNVTFSVEGLPTGVTGSPSGGSGTGTSTITTATITVLVGGGVAPGVYNLTLRATAAGQTDRTSAVTLTVTEPPTISLAAAPSPVTIAAGSAGTATITLTRGGPFTGAVALAVSGQPVGVTAAFAPTSIATGSTTSTLTLTVAGSVAAGNYPLVITGTGTGVANAVLNLTLTVGNGAPQPGYTLSANPGVLSVPQNTSAISTVTVVRTGGFTGTVNLAINNLPSDLTAVFNPPSLTSGMTQSVLTITAPVASAGVSSADPALVPVGNYPLVITGTAEGLANVTTGLTVNVTPLQTGSFTTGLSQNAVSIQQGTTSGGIDVTIVRVAPFVAGVGFTVQGLPANTFANFAPVAIAAGGTTANLTFTASSGAVPGVYPLVITSIPDAPGVASVTTNFTLTITAAPIGGAIAFQFCDPAFEPLWFAYQDGVGGGWTPVAKTGGDTFSFDLLSNAGGVAWVAPDGSGGFQTRVLISSKAYITTLAAQNCASTSATRSLTGTVAGAGDFDQTLVSIGNATTTVFGAGPFMLNRVPSGPRTLVASQVLGGALQKVIIRRNVNYATTIPALAFNDEGFNVTNQNLTITNLMGWVASPITQYYTDNATSSGMIFNPSIPSSGPFTFPSIPAERQVAGDFHYVTATAIPGAMDFSQIRSAGRFFYSGGPQTINLGPAMSTPTVTVAAGGGDYLRLQITGPVQDEYNRLISFAFGQDGKSATMMVTGSPFATGGGATYTATFPNFTGLANFNSAWLPTSGVTATWNAALFGWDGVGILETERVEGAEVRSAGTSGTVPGSAQMRQ